MKKPRKKMKYTPRAAAPVNRAQMFGALEAAVPSPARAPRFWPSLDARKEIDAWDLFATWRQGRALYENHDKIRMVVKTMVDLMGWIMPLPDTADAAWNEEAMKAFLRRCERSALFERSGRLSWSELQEWVERRAIIDGDALVVLSLAEDGGAQFALFSAPQVDGGPRGDQLGVQTDDGNRVLYYFLRAEDGKVVPIPGASAFLYAHEQDPARVRGISEIASVINNAADLQDVEAFTKAGIKFSASYSIVETKDKDARRAEQQSAYLARINGESPEDASAESEAAATSSVLPIVPARVAGQFELRSSSQVASLAPGRDLKVLHDNRPSNETHTFMGDLADSLAYAFGMDPAVVFHPEKLGSASARFTLRKMSRAILRRLRQREQLCRRMWEHFVACEVACGRLRPPADEDMMAVRWIPLRDLTIDAGREVQAVINAEREGLADADQWARATTGLTAAELLRRRAARISLARQLAEEFGISLTELLPGALGSTAPQPTEEKSRGSGEDASDPSRGSVVS